MKLSRPAHLRFEFRDSAERRLASLLSATGEHSGGWFATGAHLDGEVEVDAGDLALVARIPEHGIDRGALDPGDAVAIDRLLARGVLLGEDPAHESHAARDAAVRATGWWGPAALAQRLGRWQDVDVAAIEASEGPRRLDAMIADNGLPPTERVVLCPGSEPIRLEAADPTAFDELLLARATCRNFDMQAGVSLAQVSRMLRRVFGAQGAHELAPGAVMLKKNSPSGGGLHSIEAFVLVQRVDGLAPGLYHYECIGHALEPMQGLSPAEASAFAHELVAGQSWFAGAPVLVLMAARFGRTFWKYRNHAKAWKVIQLDAGHLSQNLYLSATEQGLGAFITAAINDECAERLFGLDGITAGAIAVCGFGKRASETTHVEFDPLGKAVR